MGLSCTFTSKHQALQLMLLVIGLIVPAVVNNNTYDTSQHYIPAIAMNIFTYVQYFYFIHCICDIQSIIFTNSFSCKTFTMFNTWLNSIKITLVENHIDQCYRILNLQMYFAGIVIFRHFKYIFHTTYDPSGHIFVLGLQIALILKLQKSNIFFVVLSLWFYTICVFTELFYHIVSEIVPAVAVILIFIAVSYWMKYPEDTSDEAYEKFIGKNTCCVFWMILCLYIGFTVAICIIDIHHFNWLGLIHDFILHILMFITYPRREYFGTEEMGPDDYC